MGGFREAEEGGRRTPPGATRYKLERGRKKRGSERGNIGFIIHC